MLNINSRVSITIGLGAAALAAALGGQWTLPAAAAGPSYSCSGSLLPTERAICDNANLSALDVALTALYQNVYNKTSGAARDRLVSDEKAWIARRDSCSTNVTCITNVYRQRIAQLGG
ncbi:MAG: lysozyme inhibitor LprI family protein [Xanthobacteraceae bacterium]